MSGIEDIYNSKFLNYIKEIRQTSWNEFEGALIFHNNIVHCYQNGKKKDMSFMDIDEYNIYKTLAHTLIFYSQKHNYKYQKINDLCIDIKNKISNCLDIDSTKGKLYYYHQKNNTTTQSDKRYETLFNYDIATLKKISSEQFLQELHDIVQRQKRTYFNNVWPKSLLILVAGPTSPRFGHPAMQYFTRLTNNDLEMNAQMIKDNIMFNKLDNINYNGRKLYYIENCNELEKIIQIGLSLYVEETEFSKYESMKKDILASDVQDYLHLKCNK